MDTLENKNSNEEIVSVENNEQPSSEKEIVAEPIATEIKAEPIVLTETAAVETPTVEDVADENNNLDLQEEQVFVDKLNEITRSELVELLKELIQTSADALQKNKVELIKQHFYKKQKSEREALFQQQAESEEANPTTPLVDELENELKSLLAEYKEKRAKIIAEENAVKESNLQERLNIIETVTKLVENPEKVHEHVAEFKQLQQRWREIGALPNTANAGHLFKTFNLHVESFYDLLKMNIELRDYDFKKNLEAKTALCEEAENLDQTGDIVPVFRRLQQLHDEWTQIGPVAKDLREPLWLRFKEISTLINKKYQAHFEKIKEQEEHNLYLKTRVCETIEAIDYEAIKTFKDWEAKTEEITALQAEWRSIGFATRKMNVKIYERYRAACDVFFSKKGEFYIAIKKEQNANLEKKRFLISQAEALKESTDWGSTTKKLIELQREWKSIGSVPKKQSEIIWKQFITACDYFFEQKEKNFAGQKSIEKENLDKKVALIDKIETLEKGENISESIAALKTLVGEWREIGHVPFKEKDNLYKRFREACDKQFDALNVDAANRHLDSFAERVESMAGQDKNKLFRERERLLKQFDRLRNEIKTSENNIGFFTSSSKKPSPMLIEMQRKIDKLKSEKDMLLNKIQMIEKQLS